MLGGVCRQTFMKQYQNINLEMRYKDRQRKNLAWAKIPTVGTAKYYQFKPMLELPSGCKQICFMEQW